MRGETIHRLNGGLRLLWLSRSFAETHHAFRQAHFLQRQQKRQRGFGALVQIDAVNVQRVETAAGAGVVKGLAEIVPPKKPLERLARFIEPEIVPGADERLPTGRNCGGGLDRLLIKFRPRSALSVKTAGTDGAEMAGFRRLLLREPAQTAQADVHGLRMIGGLSTDQQRLRQ